MVFLPRSLNLSPANVALLVSAVVATVAWLVGGLREVRFFRVTLGPYTLFYRTYQGPYPKIGPTFADVGAVASKLGLRKLGGLYFDDPSKVSAIKCRAFVGVLLEPEECEEHGAALEAEGLVRHEIPRTAFVGCPWTFISSLAPIAIPVAMMRIYSAARSLPEEHGHPIKASFEVYDGHDMVTVCFPLENHGAFAHPADD